ncbi:PQQ-dependent sugar dehydrogenase [Virgibacillus sp. NKC19-16]|uniref:PQQ-dependent sugar dehydrogenase n=1 Tax=Virgibacillus salidurans TaxID=2831673 RepID=UPI001F381304|nr:PQQ-dependent sugar dehydrogenase [Virgibacillus sp. NKC19-16]UJL46342.1 PQQ-dependent sugar dehydrogenase [Virgibacillus sp. NKC19-16]
MKNVKVNLRPIVSNLNLPTVMKSAMPPGDAVERLFIATQLGEIFCIGNGEIRTFLDIRQRVLELGTANGGYDERGLLGVAFHPAFYYNGLFYLHYSAAGTQGPGAPLASFIPDPCDPENLNNTWTNRETHYDHIDTVEEWVWQSNGQPQIRRTLLNLRRPFANHNGVDSLNFSPETGKLVLTTGDGGSGYDPFNLSQDDREICGKIIEIDVAQHTSVGHPPIVTRFHELPASIQGTLTVIVKGVRNSPGISFQRYYDQYMKYVGNVGQELVESIFSFAPYKPISVPHIVQATKRNAELDQEGFINLGWRGWEGDLPTPILRDCNHNPDSDEKSLAYYDEVIKTSVKRIQPLTSYYHQDPRPDKFAGTALTGVHAYMGRDIPDLTGSVVFTDIFRTDNSQTPARGVLAYTRPRPDCKLSDFHVIETDYDFGSESAYFVSLGTDPDQSRLYLGVYGSMNVTDFNQGTVFEIVP